ncbi:MAG: PEGA domain-containing protein [Deltaproteobacteria bacterium]|nr:PEGA domain-containing protein [Deltaproteobacteria bacterium]
MEGLPPGAEVYVEGVIHPERPIVIDGHESPYTFRVEAEGFLPWVQDVQVHSDLTLAIRMWTPEEAAAYAEAAAKKKRKGKSSEEPAGPTELTFDGSGTGEGGAVKKKKKGKLFKPTSPGITKLKSLGKE